MPSSELRGFPAGRRQGLQGEIVVVRMQEVRCQLAWFRGGGVGAAPRTFTEIRTAVGDVDGETDAEQIPVVGDRRRVWACAVAVPNISSAGAAAAARAAPNAEATSFLG